MVRPWALLVLRMMPLSTCKATVLKAEACDSGSDATMGRSQNEEYGFVFQNHPCSQLPISTTYAWAGKARSGMPPTPPYLIIFVRTKFRMPGDP